MELCFDGIAKIREFLSLLTQGVDPNICDLVRISKTIIFARFSVLSVLVRMDVIHSGMPVIMGDKILSSCFFSTMLMLTWLRR